MKKTNRIFALSLGALMSLALFAGCKDDTGGNAYVASGASARICYDNLGGGYLSSEDTQYKLELKKEAEVTLSETDATGSEAESGSVAVYDAASKTLTAVGSGTATLTLKDNGSEVATVRVEVAPAYATDPHNQYNLSSANDFSRDASNLLGGTHDPSLIEVTENGAPAYYIFSTGWNQGNEIRRSTDLIHWEYKGKATATDVEIDDISEWIGEPNKPSDMQTANQPSIQWWAPDIVPAYGGGYWLYTCCVSNLTPVLEGENGEPTDSYSKACIVLFYSDTLEKESFEYVGVLMQSCIPQSNGDIDVNSIDPQIIYSPEGNMYMAYGSFGTGNWMLELDPKTGLRKDGFYSDGNFLEWTQIRAYRNEVIRIYNNFQKEDIEHSFYGKMISLAAMEAPIIARHDNVTVSDEEGTIEENKTFYYSMHSYNGLAAAYMMWGGRSESVWGRYLSTGGGIVYNQGPQSTSNQGNKYMGTFCWADKAATAIDIKLPGHNDLFTTASGLNVAAYITRTDSWKTAGVADGTVFVSQIHQYYLNSLGDIVINPNRYGGEVNRSVSKEELLNYTKDNRFKMVCMINTNDTITSVDVVLAENGDILYNDAKIGNWLMYGKGYIKFSFTDTSKINVLALSGEDTYYGVVRPAWLDDQNKSGFTITCMGRSGGTRSMAMFMNNYSTIGD